MAGQGRGVGSDQRRQRMMGVGSNQGQQWRLGVGSDQRRQRMMGVGSDQGQQWRLGVGSDQG